MVPAGEADFLLVLEPTQVNRSVTCCAGRRPDYAGRRARRTVAEQEDLNVALVGVLSAHLPMAEDQWLPPCARVLRGASLKESEGVPDRRKRQREEVQI